MAEPCEEANRFDFAAYPRNGRDAANKLVNPLSLSPSKNNFLGECTGGTSRALAGMAILETPDKIQRGIEERILAAAADLFSRGGYRGVSTREIASSAGVNEVTIYRHYPSKRHLYLTVLAEELGRVHLRGDQLKELAEAQGAHQVLTRALALIETVVLRRPLLLPLALFGSLEAAADVDQLLKKHLGEFVEILIRYLEPWMKETGERSPSASGGARGLVMALVAIAVFRPSLDRVFPATPRIGPDQIEVLIDVCVADGRSPRSMVPSPVLIEQQG